MSGILFFIFARCEPLKKFWSESNSSRIPSGSMFVFFYCTILNFINKNSFRTHLFILLMKRRFCYTFLTKSLFFVCLFVCLFVCFVLFCFVLFCFVLFCFVLFCFVLFFIYLFNLFLFIYYLFFQITVAYQGIKGFSKVLVTQLS